MNADRTDKRVKKRNYSAARRQGLKPQAKQLKPTQVGWKSVRFSVLQLLALSFSSGRTPQAE